MWITSMRWNLFVVRIKLLFHMTLLCKDYTIVKSPTKFSPFNTQDLWSFPILYSMGPHPWFDFIRRPYGDRHLCKIRCSMLWLHIEICFSFVMCQYFDDAKPCSGNFFLTRGPHRKIFPLPFYSFRVLDTFDTRLQRFHPRSRLRRFLISFVTNMARSGNTDPVKRNSFKFTGEK